MQTIPKLNLNSNPNTFLNGDAKDCMNFVTTKDQKAIRNEDGFSHLHTSSGIIIGKIDLPNGFVLFSRSPDTIVLIENDTLVKSISSFNFKFRTNNPITGSYVYNSDGDLIITFTEGVDSTNETRVLNITQSSISLTSDQVDRLNIIPSLKYPTITSSVASGGSLISGSYQICLAYKVDNSIYSNYSILHEPIYVSGDIQDHIKIGDKVNRNIVLNLVGLDGRYAKYKLGILFRGEDAFEKAYETDDYDIITSTIKLFSVDSLASTSIDDLTIGSISYVRDNTHVPFMGRLYRANVKTVDYSGLDAVMNNIASQTKIVRGSIAASTSLSNIDAINNKKHFKEGEHYILYLGCIDYKGNFVNAYPIPFKEGDETDWIYLNEDSTFKIHKIPYVLSYMVKFLPTLSASLPPNIDSLLGTKFKDIITSFCFFYAEHNLYNSKILGQGFAIRDFSVNDFNNSQSYHGAFRASDKLRFYSFEHLFAKSSLSNAYLYNSKKLYGFRTEDKGDYSKYKKIFREDGIIGRSSVVAPVNRIEHVLADNVNFNNIAGESYHRLYMTPTSISSILGGAVTNEVGQDGTLCNDSNDEDGEYASRNLTALADLTSSSTSFYDSPYEQKLVICSPIISKPSYLERPIDSSDLISLSGDFFFDNFTFRITGPVPDYRYGTEDIDLQGEDYSYKIIVSSVLESRFNLRMRYNGVGNYERVFNLNILDDISTKPMYDIPYANDNFIVTSEGKGYSLACHNNGYDYNLYEKELDTKFHFSNRVIRSVVDFTESKGTPWRIFKTNDYKDFPIARGVINGIEADERAVYIQQAYSLFVAAVRDQLSSTDAGESYLGSSDVFDREPIEVMFDKVGYIGCDNRFGFIMTPFGYVVVDTSKKNIFLIKITQISRLNDFRTEEFFDKYLKSGLTNPYLQKGIALIYDDEVKSVFLSHQDEIDNGFTIHYNFTHKAWLSFHSYIADSYIANRIASYCIKNNSVYKRYGNGKGIYFSSIPVKSTVTFAYNVEPETYKQICGIVWDTLVKLGNTVVYDQTFDQIMLYNDTQCTGQISIYDYTNWFDTSSGIYKKDSWFFNEIKDIVVNDRAPFMNQDGSLISSNLSPNLDWFNMSEFIAKYVFIKFEYNNYFTDISKRSKKVNEDSTHKQLELVFTFLDINAIKSIR